MGTGTTIANDAGARLTGPTIGPLTGGPQLGYFVSPSGGDDTNAINNTIAVAALTGGVVVFSGFYTVSSLTIKSKVTLFALSGPGSVTINQIPDAVNALLSVIIIAGNGITIDGLFINGSILAGHEADDNIACILISAAGRISDTIIRNCTLTGKSCAVGTNVNGANGFAITRLHLDHNICRNLMYGIRIGPYSQNAVVNDTIIAERNDIQISATGGFSGFYFARPLQIINTNKLTIRNNISLGGFSGIETFGGTGVGTRPRQTDVHIDNNTTDGHIGFTQVTNGTCVGNIVDLLLRDPSWPPYDDPTVLANWSYLPGIESADNTNCVTANNVVSNQVGAGIQFGLVVSCACDTNTIVGTGVTATPPAYAHGIWLQYNPNINSSVSNNIIQTSAKSGIAQTDIDAFNLLTSFTIHNNKIQGCQQHGIHIRNIAATKVSSNTIKNANLAVSGFNGIDCTRPFPGTDVIRNLTVEDNTIDGAATGIFNNYFEVGEIRANSYVNNKVRNCTTSFNAIGRHLRNTDGNNTPTQTLTATHLDFATCNDVLILDPGAVANLAFIDNGVQGERVTIRFARADTLVVNSANLLVAGSANVTPTINSIMTFICTLDNAQTANIWQEESRAFR